jgi:hypothetical protein
LLAHLDRAACRRNQPVTSDAVLGQALRAAAAEGNGELVIRSGARVAKIFFHDGRIAWIHVPGEPSSLADIFSAGSTIDGETVRLVIEECRTSGSPLSDTLIRWGVLDREQARTRLRHWLRKQLVVVLGFEHPAALFLPQALSYSDDLLYSLEELIPPPRARTVVPSMKPPGQTLSVEPPFSNWNDAFVNTQDTSRQTTPLLEDCLRLEGARGAAVLDCATGACLGRHGDGLDPDIAWAFLRGLNVIARQECVSDSVVTTDLHHHLVRSLSDDARRFLYLVVDRRQVNVGSALIQLKLVLQRRSAHVPGR